MYVITLISLGHRAKNWVSLSSIILVLNKTRICTCICTMVYKMEIIFQYENIGCYQRNKMIRLTDDNGYNCLRTSKEKNKSSTSRVCEDRQIYCK